LALTPELFHATAAGAPPIVPEVVQKDEELDDAPTTMIARVKPCPILWLIGIASFIGVKRSTERHFIKTVESVRAEAARELGPWQKQLRKAIIPMVAGEMPNPGSRWGRRRAKKRRKSGKRARNCRTLGNPRRGNSRSWRWVVCSVCKRVRTSGKSGLSG
jgi:hypothetical protein